MELVRFRQVALKIVSVYSLTVYSHALGTLACNLPGSNKLSLIQVLNWIKCFSVV